VNVLGGKIVAPPHPAADGRGFTAADPAGAVVGFYEEEQH
jgi:predicted enzyme related to lactoylglutathione lyase